MQQNLLYNISSLLTIYQIQRIGAAHQITALTKTGIDAGLTTVELTGKE